MKKLKFNFKNPFPIHWQIQAKRVRAFLFRNPELKARLLNLWLLVFDQAFRLTLNTTFAAFFIWLFYNLAAPRFFYALSPHIPLEAGFFQCLGVSGLIVTAKELFRRADK